MGSAPSLGRAKGRPCNRKAWGPWGAACCPPTTAYSQLHGFGLCGGPVNCTRLRDEAPPGGVLEIPLQAAAVFRIQRKVDVVAQIRLERALRQFQIVRRLVADCAQVRRSEEHTSELQSRDHLVCRLLLE